MVGRLQLPGMSRGNWFEPELTPRAILEDGCAARAGTRRMATRAADHAGAPRMLSKRDVGRRARSSWRGLARRISMR
jgi:hypothetical protein